MGCGTDSTAGAGEGGSAATQASPPNDSRHADIATVMQIPALDTITRFFWSSDQYATIQPECKSRESPCPLGGARATIRRLGSCSHRALSGYRGIQPQGHRDQRDTTLLHGAERS